MLGASNLRQQRRLWTLLERPDMIKKTNEERDADREREAAMLREIMRTRTADEWEVFLQANHVPAARVRTMGEAVADPSSGRAALFIAMQPVTALMAPSGFRLLRLRLRMAARASTRRRLCSASTMRRYSRSWYRRD